MIRNHKIDKKYTPLQRVNNLLKNKNNRRINQKEKNQAVAKLLQRRNLIGNNNKNQTQTQSHYHHHKKNRKRSQNLKIEKIHLQIQVPLLQKSKKNKKRKSDKIQAIHLINLRKNLKDSLSLIKMMRKEKFYLKYLAITLSNVRRKRKHLFLRKSLKFQILKNQSFHLIFYQQYLKMQIRMILNPNLKPTSN